MSKSNDDLSEEPYSELFMLCKLALRTSRISLIMYCESFSL